MNNSCSILIFRGDPPTKTQITIIRAGDWHNIFKGVSKFSNQPEPEKKEDPKK